MAAKAMHYGTSSISLWIIYARTYIGVDYLIVSVVQTVPKLWTFVFIIGFSCSLKACKSGKMVAMATNKCKQCIYFMSPYLIYNIRGEISDNTQIFVWFEASFTNNYIWENWDFQVKWGNLLFPWKHIWCYTFWAKRILELDSSSQIKLILWFLCLRPLFWWCIHSISCM